MNVLTGVNLVLADRVLGPATLVIDGERIVEMAAGTRFPEAPGRIDLPGHFVVPGLVDVHVHGVEGVDSLDGEPAVATIARRLPRYGVTAFCPTTVACSPGALRVVLAAVREARRSPDPNAARVLPAHLESNFIAPEYRGAQPLDCLRRPPSIATPAREPAAVIDDAYSGADILAEIAAARREVGIVTLAPELDGAPELIEHLVSCGHRVSLGHSGADYEQGLAGVAAGACHATHLFNRMPPFHHRKPGLVGAVLDSETVAAEIICDGYHVHTALVRAAVARKTPSKIMAISDGTAGSGLAAGSRASLGGRLITVGEAAAFLADGTLAGSTLTMDRALRFLVEAAGYSLADAAAMCSTVPATELGLAGQGRLSAGALADLAIFDDRLRLVATWIGGRPVFDARATS